MNNIKHFIREQISKSLEAQKKELFIVIRAEMEKYLQKTDSKIRYQEEKIQSQKLTNDRQDANIQKVFRQIEEIREKIKGIELISKTVNIPKSNIILPSFESPIIANPNLINPNSANFNQFLINGSIVELINESKSNPQLLGNISVANKTENSFTFINGLDGIYVGIVHPKWIGDRSSYGQDRKQCIGYVVHDGGIWESGKKMKYGIGTKLRETVVMSVPKKGGKITWTVNGQIRGQYSYNQDSSMWVPCVWLFKTGDKVKWE